MTKIFKFLRRYLRNVSHCFEWELDFPYFSTYYSWIIPLTHVSKGLFFFLSFCVVIFSSKLLLANNKSMYISLTKTFPLNINLLSFKSNSYTFSLSLSLFLSSSQTAAISKRDINMNHSRPVGVHRNELWWLWVGLWSSSGVIWTHNRNARRLEADFMNMLKESEWLAGTGSDLICILFTATSLIWSRGSSLR